VKKSIKMLIITLVTVICFTLTSIAFAAGPSTNGTDEKAPNSSDSATSISNMQDTQNVKEEIKNSGGYKNINSNADAKTRGNALKDRKRVLEQTQNKLKEQIKKLENEKTDLENQYKEAVKTENQGQIQALQLQIQQKEKDINSSKDQLKQIREQIRETIRNSYTNEERNRLKSLEEELKEKNRDIKILPVDSIIAKGTMLKFDTPPVIKEGRILIPVRALTEGFGASVTWDQAKQEVTIQRGEVKIVLQIGNNLAYVNGEEVKIDVPPETINNRTIVPLRFIAEKLGLKVNWDEESETVEVEGSQAMSTNE
jgi:hypothetical protein